MSARARGRVPRTQAARPPGSSMRSCRPHRRASRHESPASARSSLSRSRSSWNTQPRSFSPNVVGSACTPCVRPIVTVGSMLLGAHQRDLRRALDALADELPGPLNDEGERGIEDVRRREPVVEPATVGAEIGRDGVHERRDVVVRDPFSLRDLCGAGNAGTLTNGPRARGRNDSGLGPGVEDGELHGDAIARASPPRTRPWTWQASRSGRSLRRF